MYFNDTHIICYAIFGILGAMIGQFVDYCTRCFLKQKNILSKENLIQYQKVFLPNYKLMGIMAIFYIALVYKFGGRDIISLIQYSCLIPMLICAFIVDYKVQIIPNRLSLTIFEIGLTFVFIYGMSNTSISMDMILGMCIGGGIFLLITVIGGLIAGKEAMGLRRRKINGSFRFIFWICNYNSSIYNVIFIGVNCKYITNLI